MRAATTYCSGPPAASGRTGQVAAARDVCTTLYRTALYHLGPDHPDTLTVRSNLAYWRGEAGDAAGAAAAFEDLLADYLRVLGPDHPDTLAARTTWRLWRGEAGDAAGAATAFEELLADHLRVLGPDHPHTLAARGKLATGGARRGTRRAQRPPSKNCSPTGCGSWDPTTPTPWSTRQQPGVKPGVLRGKAGDAACAAAASETLLADYLRVLGPDHPDTLAACHNLAYWRGEAGDAAGAAAAFEELLADILRVLGPNHPHTLTACHNLAYWRGEAGDAAGAAAAFEELLADRLRVLGPRHPDTLATRHDLALWRGRARLDSVPPSSPGGGDKGSAGSLGLKLRSVAR